MGRYQRGINDLQTVNSTLAKEWDFDKNGELSPSDVAAGSHMHVWWICSSCGHSWIAEINARNRGNGCPKCRYKKSASSCHTTRLKRGDNTLQKIFPNLLTEWDYKKNGDLSPKDVTPSSSNKVWWRCLNCGSSYQSRIAGRTGENKGCPVCAGQKVQTGINDLATINPYLASEWDLTANGNLLPTMVTAFNDRKVGWVCSVCGTKWNATIASRSKGTGCPNCSKLYHSSFPEQAVYWYIMKRFPNAVNGYRPIWLKRYGEIDIYIPDLKIGIEYDGCKWHSKKAKDEKKGRAIAQYGVLLIRIREPNLNEVDDGSITISIQEVDKRHTYLQKVIYDVASIINKHLSANWIPDVDIERDRLEIMTFYLTNRKKNALSVTNPEIAAEWDYSKNSSLTPEQVNAGSEARVYWCCKKLWVSLENEYCCKNHGS